MEQQSLEFAIASLSSPSLELMQTLQQLIVKTSDGTSPLFLVYGALVANFGADKKSEMVPFLTKWIPKDGLGNSEILVNLLHALGNTRSSQAVEYIIRYTQHDDRAVKAAAVSSLCFFIHEPVVQQELSSILERNSSDKDALVGGIIEALQEGYSYNQDVSLNLELIEHLVNVTVGLRNAHLRNELILFLERVGTSDTLRMAQRLSEIRQRRSASTNTNNWSNPSNVYDAISSAEERRMDVKNYPNRRAYLWTKRLGTDTTDRHQFYLQCAAGMFAGRHNCDFKILAKGVVHVNLFGKTEDVVVVLGNFNKQNRVSTARVYVRFGSRTLVDVNNSLTYSIPEYERTVLNPTIPFTIYGVRLTLEITLRLNLGGTVEISALNTAGLEGSVSLTPTVTASIGASLGISFLVS